MVFLAVRKIPVLVALEENQLRESSRFDQKIFAKVKNSGFQIKQTFSLLQALKPEKFSQQDEKGKEVDLEEDYWEKVKTE